MALRHLGYACLCLSLPDSSPRGTILRNATPERLRELIGENLRRLERVLRFNAEHDVRLFRISSDVIPFGSHPVNGIAWWEEFRPQLAALGRLVHEAGARVSMHPGQYTVLSSPVPKVVTAAVADLVYHARFLDALGLDAKHKIVLHLGGAYGDKPAAAARWVEQARCLPESVQARLVIENDERLYGAEDVLAASAATGLPFVLDTLHHFVYAGGAPSSALFEAAFATWDTDRDGPPKVHFSTQAAGARPGAHAELADAEEFLSFLKSAPSEPDFDCMLEAKGKDLALFRLRDALSAPKTRG